MSDAIEYRTIERFEGYSFGSDGSVWSCWTKRSGMCDEWNQVSPATQRNGYLSVWLRMVGLVGRRKFMSVHRLILEAFVGPCPDGCEARHFPDRTKTNCTINNLSWATRLQNAHDRNTHGTASAAYGEDHHKVKLTAALVLEARKLVANGEKIAELARRYKVNEATLHSAVRGKSWKFLKADSE